MNRTPFFSSRTKAILGSIGFLSLVGIFGYQNYDGSSFDQGLLSADLLTNYNEGDLENLPVSDPNLIEAWYLPEYQMEFNQQNRITAWNDASGKINDMKNDDETSAPTLIVADQEESLNYHAAASFEQGNFIASDAGGYSNHVFAVVQLEEDLRFDGQGQTLLSFENNGQEVGSLKLNAALQGANDEVISFVSGQEWIAVSSNNFFYPAQTPLMIYIKNSPVTAPQVRINGSEDVVNQDSGNPLDPIAGASLKLGGDFQGRIAEVITANDGLSEAELDSIESYLGIKYGIPKGFEEDYSFNAGQDVVFNGSFNINYTSDVFGIASYRQIGLDIGSDQALHTFSHSTQPDGVLYVGGASDLDPGESLIIGHNAGTNQWTNTFTQQGAELLGRRWYMEEVSTEGNNGGVGSVVMSFQIGDEDFEVDSPDPGTSYALAFSEDQDLTNADIHYVYLNDQSNDGDVQGGDGKYSGILQDPAEYKYFTLVRFSPSPPSIEPDSVEQLQDLGKVEVTAIVSDVNAESNIEVAIEFELNPDGQCDGPWNPASINGPVTGTQQAAPVLLNQQQQQLNDNFQIANISTEDEGENENQISFIWNAGNDVAETLASEPQSNHCLRFFVRDPALDGEPKIRSLSLEGLQEEELESAEIEVKMVAPQELAATQVSISNGIANNEIINNDGTSETFKVKANLAHEVTCEEQQGYTLTTNPQPYPVPPMQPNTSQTVECTYVDEDQQPQPDPEDEPEDDPEEDNPEEVDQPEEGQPDPEEEEGDEPEEEEGDDDPEDQPQEEGNDDPEEGNPEEGDQEDPQQEEEQGTATLKITVTGLTSGLAAIDVSQGVANNINVTNNSEVSYVVDAGVEYEITCQEDITDHFLVNGSNPKKITLNNGSEFTHACQYSAGNPDEGTIEYTEEVAKEIFESETACLEYDPEKRDFEFSDLENLNLIGAKSATILKDTFLFGGEGTIKNEELQNIKEANEQYLLSGSGSTIGGFSEQFEAEANVLGLVSRADALKFVMLSFCIPIFDSDSLEEVNTRLNGDPVPVFGDDPRKNTVTRHIVDTAKVLGVVDGVNYQGKIDPNSDNEIQWERPVTKEELTKMVVNAQQLWQGYQINPDLNQARNLNLDQRWSYPFYARALSGSGESAIEKAPSMMQNPELAARRGQMFDYVFFTLQQAGLYKDPEVVQAAYNAL